MSTSRFELNAVDLAGAIERLEADSAWTPSKPFHIRRVDTLSFNDFYFSHMLASVPVLLTDKVTGN